MGDQLLYDQIFNLITQHPVRYSWVIPENGDLHFGGHSVGSFHDLWYLPFTSWVVRKLGPGFEKVIKEKDDNTTHSKHDCHFYLLLTLSIVILLHETLDHALLKDHSALLELATHKKGASLKYHLGLCRMLLASGSFAYTRSRNYDPFSLRSRSPLPFFQNRSSVKQCCRHK